MIHQGEMLELLSQHIVDKRKDKIFSTSQERTRYLTVVLDNIYYSQNASAVIRTCDCFGVQDIHLIEDRNKLKKINKHVTIGSHSWINIHRYKGEANSTKFIINSLKKKGYRIIATIPNNNNESIRNFDLNIGKTALVFGNEQSGVSKEVKEHADGFATIPMFGFAESFNISVSAALILYELTNKLRESEIDWKLNPQELEKLRLEWVKKTAHRSEEIEKEYYKRKIKNQ